LQVRAIATLDLDDEEKEEIAELIQDLVRRQQEAQAELNVVKAELERLLIRQDGNSQALLREARKILEQSMEFRVELEMITIEARIRFQEIMGEERFARYNMTLKRLRTQQ
jgi:hypothetical protein